MNFKVGEIATLCNSTARPQYEGMDCEIVGGLELRGCLEQPDVMKLRYLVKAADGHKFAVVPYCLRKKPRTLEPNLAAWVEAPDVIDRVKSPAWADAAQK